LAPTCCFCQQGVADASTDLESSSGWLDRRAQDERFEHSRSPRRCFGYCRPRDEVSRDHGNLRFPNDLVARADRPPPKVVRNPLRSDLTVPSYSGSWNVTPRIGNSDYAIGRWNVTPNDGAYPRPTGRSIAPAPRIRLGDDRYRRSTALRQKHCLSGRSSAAWSGWMGRCQWIRFRGA